ncbi:ABC transporter substrate-binding protein [Thermoplasmatales archaeon AK]|nr:ABC transporter substrate-binding protein [Thermoplasmatales archaeon AK]
MKKWVTAVLATIIAIIVVGTGVYVYKENFAPIYQVSVVEIKNPNGTATIVNLSQSGSYILTTTAPVNGVLVLNGEFSRVVSMVPSSTVTLYGLGDYGKVVGVDMYSTYPPPSAFRVPVLGDEETLPVEKIANLSPQVVLSGEGFFSSSQIDQLVRGLGIPYLVMNPQSIGQIENQTVELAQLMGGLQNATSINNWMNQSLQDIHSIITSNHLGGLSVFYYLDSQGGAWTAGNGTFINDYFQLLNATNIATGYYYYIMSRENITSENPSYIILDHYVNTSALTDNTSFSTLAAVKDHNYSVIPNDNYFNEPDFRVIYAIYWLGQQFYPEYVNISMVPKFPVSLQYPPGANLLS